MPDVLPHDLSLTDPVPAMTPPARQVSESGDLPAAVSRLADRHVTIEPGPWDAEASLAGDALLGGMLLEGLALRQVGLSDVPAATFVLPGDLVDARPGASFGLSEAELTWTVVETARVAVLGERFLAAARRWPGLMVALHRSQADQLSRAGRDVAIAQMPRVEQRVLAVFSALAEDRGRVTGDGVVVDVCLTHETLGRLVGARRPTVSLALKTLAEAGMLGRRDRSWVLARGASLNGPAGNLAAVA